MATVVLGVVIGVVVAVASAVALEVLMKASRLLIPIAEFLAGPGNRQRVGDDARMQRKADEDANKPPARVIVNTMGFVWVGWRAQSIGSRLRTGAELANALVFKSEMTEITAHSTVTGVLAGSLMSFALYASGGFAPHSRLQDAVSIACVLGLMSIPLSAFAEWNFLSGRTGGQWWLFGRFAYWFGVGATVTNNHLLDCLCAVGGIAVWEACKAVERKARRIGRERASRFGQARAHLGCG